jgi:hypothetical protein
MASIIAFQFVNASQFHNLLPILKFCLASLVYHEKFLYDHLPPSHPVFQTHLFTEMSSAERAAMDPFCDGLNLSELRAETETPYDRNVIRATGIPPHVAQLVYLHRLESTPEKIIAAVKALLHEREFHPSSVVTVATLQESLEQIQKNLLVAVSKISVNPSFQQCENEKDLYERQGKKGERLFWHLWKKDNVFRRLPENYELPKKCRLEFGWRLWFLGNKTDRISKLCAVKPSDFQSRQQKKIFSEWRKCFSHFTGELEKLDVLFSEKSEREVMDAYQCLFTKQIMQPVTRKARTVRECQKTVLSLAKQIRKLKPTNQRPCPPVIHVRTTSITAS